MSWQQPTVSERCKAQRRLPEHFHGYSIICEACERPFRTFREGETHCRCCRGSVPSSQQEKSL